MMANYKLSAKAVETIEYLQAVLKETDHYVSLVEQFAAARSKGYENFATQLSRELGQLRQKAMMRGVPYLADAAGQLGVMASRGGSPMMKGRLLRDGVAAFRSLIERNIKATAVADENEQKQKAYQAEKERRASVEAVKARVLAEEAREAQRASAGPGPRGQQAPSAPAKPGAPGSRPGPGAAPSPAPATPRAKPATGAPAPSRPPGAPPPAPKADGGAKQ
jgi:hypothetical protein